MSIAREEWEQNHLDLVEERKLVQASLNGVWRSKTDGCPHLHRREDIDRCDANEMRPCVYETGDECELFQEILEEWRLEQEICPECGQERPGDERVKAGMKCSLCAGDPYQEYLEAGVMPGNLE